MIFTRWPPQPSLRHFPPRVGVHVDRAQKGAGEQAGHESCRLSDRASPTIKRAITRRVFVVSTPDETNRVTRCPRIALPIGRNARDSRELLAKVAALVMQIVIHKSR